MRSFYMAGRIARQLIKDRRTLALMFLAPLFVLFILYTVLNSSIGKPNVEAVGLSSELTKAFQNQANLRTVTGKAAALDDLRNRKTDAVVVFKDPDVTVYLEGTETSVTAAVKKAVSSALGSYSREHLQTTLQQQMKSQQKVLQLTIRSQLTQMLQKLTPYLRSKGIPAVSVPQLKLPKVQFQIKMTSSSFVYLNGSADMTTFNSIAAMMMGFFIFFFVFLIAGVSFLHERISGTLDRLLATPIRRYEIVMGYFFGFGAFVIVQTLIIQLFMVYVLRIPLKGNFLLVLLVNVLLASGSLALGTFLSAYARNEFQMIQFVPIVIVPQILFCGLFDLRGAPLWVLYLSKVFPLTYGADALTNIALRGRGFSDILTDLILMAAYTLLFLILNTLALKRYRKI